MPIMTPPQSGVAVRMYRQGQGDCFLLCFKGDDGNPVFFLIDCGIFPGSELHDIQDIVDDIGEATGNHLDVVLITHEHMDHVNGFWSQTRANPPVVTEHFENIEIEKLWLAWTEDPDDEVANQLRESFDDTLLGLLAAEEQLTAADDSASQKVGGRVRELLKFSIGDDIEGGRTEFMASAIKGITNKRAIQYLKDKAKANNPLYLRPEEKSGYHIPNASGVRVYALGPPKDEYLIAKSLDPKGDEAYSRFRFGNNQEEQSFFSAAIGMSANKSTEGVSDTLRPFPSEQAIELSEAKVSEESPFFESYYPPDAENDKQSWRRIDNDWLGASEMIALRLDREVNNTSLVVAIELPNTKKVLLFVGDAQRGSWVSWDDQTWEDENGEEVSAKDLLGRTVLYKVGHHGSHNATLKGRSSSDYPNLNWMARGEYRDSFVAMIPANSDWAYNVVRWPHPLKSIKRALMRKAKGRVFQIDKDKIQQSYGLTDSEWAEFQNQTEETDLYFQYTVSD